jgi:hypothetical protein
MTLYYASTVLLTENIPVVLLSPSQAPAWDGRGLKLPLQHKTASRGSAGKPEYGRYTSARNYAGRDGLIPIRLYNRSL